MVNQHGGNIWSLSDQSCVALLSCLILYMDLRITSCSIYLTTICIFLTNSYNSV
jgi:hypothetical protein